jgi:hypothetical protein
VQVLVKTREFSIEKKFGEIIILIFICGSEKSERKKNCFDRMCLWIFTHTIMENAILAKQRISTADN